MPSDTPSAQKSVTIASDFVINGAIAGIAGLSAGRVYGFVPAAALTSLTMVDSNLVPTDFG